MIRRRPLTVENATVRIETLCARSEQCTFEVVKKLRDWGIGDADIKEIVKALKSRRFVDDARYAEAFVRDKMMFNRWGRVKIRQALRLKRVPDAYIDDAMATMDDDAYRSGLADLLRQKARSMPDGGASYESRGKLLRYGASRGFEAALVVSVIRELFRND